MVGSGRPPGGPLAQPVSSDRLWERDKRLCGRKQRVRSLGPQLSLSVHRQLAVQAESVCLNKPGLIVINAQSALLPCFFCLTGVSPVVLLETHAHTMHRPSHITLCSTETMQQASTGLPPQPSRCSHPAGCQAASLHPGHQLLVLRLIRLFLRDIRAHDQQHLRCTARQGGAQPFLVWHQLLPKTNPNRILVVPARLHAISLSTPASCGSPCTPGGAEGGAPSTPAGGSPAKQPQARHQQQ